MVLILEILILCLFLLANLWVSWSRLDFSFPKPDRDSKSARHYLLYSARITNHLRLIEGCIVCVALCQYVGERTAYCAFNETITRGFRLIYLE